jgi:hypothetical protein
MSKSATYCTLEHHTLSSSFPSLLIPILPVSTHAFSPPLGREKTDYAPRDVGSPGVNYT